MGHRAASQPDGHAECRMYDIRKYVNPHTPLTAGVVGITCAALGADVLLSDVADVLPLSQLNLDLNAGILAAAGGRAAVEQLDWSSPEDVKWVTATSRSVSGGSTEQCGFDFVLGEPACSEANRANRVGRASVRVTAPSL